jgi:hypothetical protein
VRGILLSVSLFGLLSLDCASTLQAADPVTVQLTVIEKGTGRPLPARVYLQAADGQWASFTTTQEGAALPFRRQSNPDSYEFHTSITSYPATTTCAAGPAKLRVVRGKEYIPVAMDVELKEGNNSLKVELERWIDMPVLGWRSGDVHAHRTIAETANLVAAEDVHVGFPLSHWTTSAEAGPISGNKAAAPKDDLPAKPIAVDGDHLLYPFNTEYELFTVGGKSHTLGAVLLIGQNKVVDTVAPPVKAIAKVAHEQGALLDLEKHSWPWSVVIAPVMKVDLFELSNNHMWETKFAFRSWTAEMAGDYMQLERTADGHTEWGWLDFGFQTYYALLNCGLDIQPSAGTGAGVHPVPFGFGRVYVHTGEDFTYENWMRGLKAGRSFVTTGPMLMVRADGQLPGERIPLVGQSKALRLQGLFSSLETIDRVEIVHDGVVAKRWQPDLRRIAGGAYAADIDETVDVKNTGWVCVRVFTKTPDGRFRFAHTAPWHVRRDGENVKPRKEEIEYLIGRCETEINRCRPVLSSEALAEFEEALSFYKGVRERGVRNEK